MEIESFSLQFEPPTLFISYFQAEESSLMDFDEDALMDLDALVDKFPSSSPSKRIRCVKLKRIADLNIDDLSEKIIKRNSDILLKKHLKQIQDLLTRLKNFNPTNHKANNEVIEEDLNKVSLDRNLQAKAIMQHNFDKNFVAPSSDNFVYDRRVDFEQPTEISEWDEEE